MLRSAVLIVCLASASFANNFPLNRDTIAQPRADDKNYLLSGNFQPEHYDLTVTPDLEKGTFSGTVIIDLTVIQESDVIDLHGHEISFDKEKVTVTKEVEDPNPDGFTTKVATPVEVTEVTAPAADDDTHFYKIKLKEKLTVTDQSVKLTISYTGSLGGNNVGFYKATYLDKEGKEKVFATTDFEPTNARQAFPCFDQPDMKATFQIHIVRPVGYTSISNMPLKVTKTLRADTVTDTFEKTSVKMPTYLVAFVVSDMTAEVLKDTVNNRDYGVYGVPHLIEDKRGKYAVDSAKAVIDKIETFLNTDTDKVSYSLPKLDQIAIPDEYFSPGAMENWGLVTYKQRYLLKKDGITTASEKQNILSIIAHELGHQWFGNIATPKSWEHLWLSEGFATYFEQWAANEVDSDMKMMEQYVTLVNHRALESDAGDNTRPMNEEAGSPKEISDLFDTIAYQKGGAVIRMLENFITTDIFKTGLRNYLKAMGGSGSAEPDDLWKGMDDAVTAAAAAAKPNLNAQTVKEIMDTWYKTKGYPVVTVSRVEGKIKLEQDRFLFSKATSGENTLWTIPISYVIEDATPDFSVTTATHWLKDKTSTTEIELEDKKWIILNNQETGYYRVNYDETLWNLTIAYMNGDPDDETTKDNYKKIHVLNRAQLIDDSFALARSGRISYTIPLRLCEYLTKETEYIPLVAFINSVQFLNNRLAASVEYKHLKTYVKDSLRAAYTKLESKRENHVDKLNWNNVINWLCRYEDKTCRDKMHDTLNAAKTDAVDPDLQTATYCGGMRKPDSALAKFKQLYERYTNAAEYLEKERVLAGMSCTFDTKCLGLLLDAAVGTKNDYEIAEADRFSVFTNMYTSSDVGLDQVLNFVVSNFNDVKTKLGDENFEKLLKGVASRTSSQKHLDKLKTVKDNVEILKEPLATIEANVKWVTDNSKVLREWLVTYGSAGFVSVSLSLLFGMLLVVSWL